MSAVLRHGSRSEADAEQILSCEVSFDATEATED